MPGRQARSHGTGALEKNIEVLMGRRFKSGFALTYPAASGYLGYAAIESNSEE